MAQDRHESNGEREKKQALAKIQHSKAHESDRMNREKDGASVVADPRNRLVEGKTDPATKERKPRDA
ncbi:hypothetical protein ACK83U_06605 [Rhizobium sp. WW22]|uniref:hypothetical protein n=1 Tax=unclassified Rhizobium TaxID=2613769 RepID=UPI0013AEBBC4|nr:MULTISPECIES: hypothetical protein [unclassified Rhizobium]MBB3386100.1 hypothetical protein [Rhizobium sp. BK098]MBB3617723.1 hypothetical protein [Rhizobium sp. BK609]MBB3683462.1 hypothetical protein [Rhizobium sp. BK612]